MGNTDTYTANGVLSKESWSFRRFNGRLARFQADGVSAETWEAKWSNQKIRKVLDSYRTGKLDDYEVAFSRYLPKGLPILEAGCGNGKYVVGLAARGYDVDGVDYAEQTVSQIQQAAPDVQVSVGDVLNLQKSDGTYGGYISLGVLEHIPEGPMEALKEARRILNPKGVALISVPLLNLARRRLLRHAPHANSARDFYQYYYSREEFEAFLDRAGFRVVDYYPHAVYAGLTRDFALGRYLHQRGFFSWQIQSRFIKWCRNAPLNWRWRFAHMLMFVCEVKD